MTRNQQAAAGFSYRKALLGVFAGLSVIAQAVSQVDPRVYAALLPIAESLCPSTSVDFSNQDRTTIDATVTYCSERLFVGCTDGRPYVEGSAWPCGPGHDAL